MSSPRNGFAGESSRTQSERANRGRKQGDDGDRCGVKSVKTGLSSCGFQERVVRGTTFTPSRVAPKADRGKARSACPSGRYMC